MTLAMQPPSSEVAMVANRPSTARRRRCRAFSLLELIIVVVIMGLLAGIAINRFSRTSESAAIAATRADLQVLNRAVEHYWAEHGVYPDQNAIAAQLTKYTNATGSTVKSARDSGNGVIFGPYVRKVPALKIGPNAGNVLIKPTPGPGVGWLYSNTNPVVRPNFNDEGGNVAPDLQPLLDELLDELGGSGGAATFDA